MRPGDPGGGVAVAFTGFDADAIPEITTEDRPPRDLFLGRRPA